MSPSYQHLSAKGCFLEGQAARLRRVEGAQLALGSERAAHPRLLLVPDKGKPTACLLFQRQNWCISCISDLTGAKLVKSKNEFFDLEVCKM